MLLLNLVKEWVIKNGLLDGLNNLYAISSVANDAKNNGHITDDNQIKEGEKGSITNPHENFVSDGTARHILDGVDIGGSNMGAEIQSNVEANPLSGDGNWGSKGIHNNLPGKGVNPDQYPSPYIDSEGNLHIPDTYKFAKTGFLQENILQQVGIRKRLQGTESSC